MIKKNNQLGFSLIELMIVIAIIAILASIALPAYSKFIRKGHRTDALAVITALQLEQQRLRSSCPSYATTIANTGTASNCTDPAAPVLSSLGYTAASGVVDSDDDIHYKITLSAASATGYTFTATPQGDQRQDVNGGSCITTITFVVSPAFPGGEATLNTGTCP